MKPWKPMSRSDGIIPILFCLLVLHLSSCQPTRSCETYLTRLRAAETADRQALLQHFLQNIREFPCVEQDSVVHFVYFGAADSVALAGDFTAWRPDLPLQRIDSTDLWYARLAFAPDARLEYKFVLNGSEWILDPRNPNQMPGGFGTNSELRMPRYRAPEEILHRADLPHGRLLDTTFTSKSLEQSRPVQIYLPPNYRASGKTYPLILFHDGPDYIRFAHVPDILDNLTAAGRIEPVVALFVPPEERTAEYAGEKQAAFTRFITQELLPWADSRFRTQKRSDRRAVIGASNGGNISLWLALNHPDVFGKVGAQSTNVAENVLRGFESGPRVPLTVFIDIGTYDIPILKQRVNTLKALLKRKGYAFHFREYPEGHNWGNWGGHLAPILQTFFPYEPAE